MGCEVSRTDLRETTGMHRPTSQILTAERSLSGASSDLSNDLEKEGGQERGKETLSGTLTLSHGVMANSVSPWLVTSCSVKHLSKCWHKGFFFRCD